MLGLVLFAGLAAAAMPSSAAADNYPSRPVKLIVPYGAGTQTDANARMIAQRLEAKLGRAFVVENRPGGNGTIGSAFVATSEPNGYTLLVTTNTTHSAAPALFKKVPYDPIKDFTPIATLERFTSVLVVNMDLPVETIEDLVAYAKARPRQLEYGFANVSGQIAGETLKRRTGIDIVAVPYRSTAQGMTDVVAGHIKVMVTGMNTAVPMAQAGKVRPLAVFSAERSRVLPQVPTFNHTVVPGFSMNAWMGVFAPANTPPPVVQVLAGALKDIMSDDSMHEKLRAEGLEVFWTGPEDFPAFLKSEMVLWGKLAQDAGIEPE
jgi:tripartite-type tricarboxylate transporter receptor subunit TctC